MHLEAQFTQDMYLHANLCTNPLMLHATCVNTPICLQQCVPLLARCLLQGALHPVWTGPEHDLKNCLWMDNSFLYTYRSANLFWHAYYNVQKACMFMKWLSWHLTHWPCMHFLWAKKTDKKFYSPRNHQLEVHMCACICLLCVPWYAWMPEFVSTTKEWQFFFQHNAWIYLRDVHGWSIFFFSSAWK